MQTRRRRRVRDERDIQTPVGVTVNEARRVGTSEIQRYGGG